MTMTGTERIAAGLARHLWQNGGRLFMHLGLFAAANKVDNKFEDHPHSVFSWFNPVSWFTSPGQKVRQGLTWLGFEGASYAAPQVGQIWDKGTPVAEKFLTPIIDSAIRYPLQYAQEQGFITIYEPRWWNPYSYSAFNNYMSNLSLNPMSWFGVSTMPVNPAYQWIEKTGAPYAGKAIATGVEYAVDFAGQCANLPGNTVQYLANMLGVSYPWVYVGAAVISIGAYYCITRGWVMSQTTNATSSANATANSNAAGGQGGSVNITFQPGAVVVPASVPSTQGAMVATVNNPKQGQQPTTLLFLGPQSQQPQSQQLPQQIVVSGTPAPSATATVSTATP